MPLDIDVSQVKDYETVCYVHKEGTEPTPENRDRRQDGVGLTTRARMLGMSSMWCDYSAITAENVDDVWARIELFQRLFAPTMTEWKDGEPKPTPVYFTRDDVVTHIGLRMNARDVAFRDWSARMMRQYAQEKGFTADPFEPFDLGPVTHALLLAVTYRGNTTTEDRLLGALQEDLIDLDEIDDQIGVLLERIERSLKRQGVTV